MEAISVKYLEDHLLDPTSLSSIYLPYIMLACLFNVYKIISHKSCDILFASCAKLQFGGHTFAVCFKGMRQHSNLRRSSLVFYINAINTVTQFGQTCHEIAFKNIFSGFDKDISSSCLVS